SPLMIGLGAAWLLVVLVLTLDLIRRTSRQEATRRMHPRRKHALDGKSGEMDGEIDNAPLRAPHLPPGATRGFGAVGAQAPTLSGAHHQPGGAADPVQRPQRQRHMGATRQAVRCTVTRHGDGTQTRHDATFVETNLRGAHDQSPEFGLFLVADGRGGGSISAGVSQVAVEHIAKRVIAAMTSGYRLPPKLIMPLFKYAVMQVCDVLRAQEGTESAESRVTVTGALVLGERAYIVNAGDCRTYLCSHKTGLQHLTKSHSVALGMVPAEPVYPEALNVSPLAQEVYLNLDDTQEPVQVDTCEV